MPTGTRGQRLGGSGSPAMPGHWVPRSVRRTEPWLLAGIALCLTVAAVFLQAGLPSAGTAALLPLLAAAWAQERPARRQGELAVRAFAVAAGALLLPLLEGAEGVTPGRLWQLWLGLTVLAYAVLLRPALSAGLLGFAVVPLGAAQFAWGTGAGLEFMAAVVLLPVAAGIAALLGAWLRRIDAGREAHCIDPSSRLCSLPGLLAYGDELLGGRTHASATLAVFDCSDLLEVRRIYGSRVAHTLLERLAARLSAIAGDRGLAARTGVAEFAVLLPGAGRERALQALQHVLGAPSRIEYEVGDSELMLVPDFLLGRLGEEEEDLGGLYRLLSRNLARLREHEEQRRRYLRRERESHSRPLAAQGASTSPPHPRPQRAPGMAATPDVRCEPEPTMPLPLALRPR